MADQNSIDFSTVLASAVHDMKNSLCLLLQSIENLSQSVASHDNITREHLASAHYEAARLNTGLVQLLSLYRAGLNNLPINIDENFLDEMVEELVATNESYINHKNMSLEVEHSADLVWYLDADLVCILLNDVLINAMRYSKKKIKLSVYTEDQYLVFKVEDDGPGYPQSMLNTNNITMQEYDISQGRTGLGLFFAKLIAHAHSTDELTGSITLENGGALGGSIFILKLP
ncbi:HAMP domain-containing sensor histidine kinase [Paraglaciecola aquimarina]|uniref:histidine kinase n=1 Tax=Paraglaciecola aquimarina TaxID=1235557 RepID=A0ABU3SXB8_9ALTE|nr:HAMP domain-containing sensor histidine kinase [Paraglaciecola aquimarina]MDU0354661.1 HAMP domain-containing sensor histidine kinase [Paraglaciecola aquimarina]